MIFCYSVNFIQKSNIKKREKNYKTKTFMDHFTSKDVCGMKLLLFLGLGYSAKERGVCKGEKCFSGPKN